MTIGKKWQQSGNVEIRLRRSGETIEVPYEECKAKVMEILAELHEKNQKEEKAEYKASKLEKELEELRASVRRIDSELAALFEKRLELSRGIVLYKLKAHKPIYDAEREAKNIEALSSLIEDVSSRPDFIRWYQLLMDISKKLQSKLIQGETK